MSPVLHGAIWCSQCVSKSWGLHFYSVLQPSAAKQQGQQQRQWRQRLPLRSCLPVIYSLLHEPLVPPLVWGHFQPFSQDQRLSRNSSLHQAVSWNGKSNPLSWSAVAGSLAESVRSLHWSGIEGDMWESRWEVRALLPPAQQSTRSIYQGFYHGQFCLFLWPFLEVFNVFF